jgi:hypothetical protein
MITTETGVYLQFFDEGEPFEKELPPLGPFELLIIRHNRIIGDREQIEHDLMGLGSVERWLEAELELRRALGDEPGGVRRSHMRIRAPRGDIIVRFYDYAGDEAPKVPELGPFYALTIGKREVRADDKLIAIRATDMSPWTLTDAVRPGVAGINKADFSVFSLSAREPRAALPKPTPIASPAPAAPAPPPMAAAQAAPADVSYAGPQDEFVERRKLQREVYVARPDPKQDEQLTPADVNLILRVDRLKQQELAEQLMIERLRKQQHVSPETALGAEPAAPVPMRFQPPVKERGAAAEAAEEEYEPESFGARALDILWRTRLLLVTVMLIAAAIAAYGYLQPRVSTAGAPPPLTFAAMGEKVQTADWTYTVTSVERTVRLGTVLSSTGGFLVVHVTVQRKNASAPPADPADFQLIDANGARSLAFSPLSDMYKGTGLKWATQYPMNAFVLDHLAFDVNPSAKSLLLYIRPANVQIRLPDP